MLVAGLALSSCSLDEKIISSSVPETFYQTPEECIAGLNGCYTNVRNILNNSKYFTMSECQSDIMFINRSDQPDATLQVSPSNPQFATAMWQYAYQGVMRANAMYAAIERAPFSDAEKAPLFAEAVVLRSFFYYILTINFGNVPFYTEEVTDDNNTRISQLPRMSASDTRNYLIDEIKMYREPIFEDELAIDGNDLMEAGICKTPEDAAKMLTMLVEEMHVHPRKNTRTDLLDLAKKYKTFKFLAWTRGTHWIH